MVYVSKRLCNWNINGGLFWVPLSIKVWCRNTHCRDVSFTLIDSLLKTLVINFISRKIKLIKDNLFRLVCLNSEVYKYISPVYWENL